MARPLLILLSLALSGCNCGTLSIDEEGDGGATGGGAGGGTGGGGAGGAGAGCGSLVATVRDFKAAHPDFEMPPPFGSDLGIVRAALGADLKPVYKPATTSPLTSGKANFDQWYRTVGGVNQPFQVPLPMASPSPGVFVYDNAAFFPLDGRGFGNEGNPHNFHFTTEIHATFLYKGGEQFTFRGDDDVWVFVNKRLAIDLGGVHGAQEKTIDFNARAAELGIVAGQTYPLDVFHAERHTTESNFRIQTSIDCFVPVTLN